MRQIVDNNAEWVLLNVGGKRFATTRYRNSGMVKMIGFAKSAQLTLSFTVIILTV